MSFLNVEIRKLRETQREMDRVARELHGDPMVEAMRDSTLYVTRDARRLSPVDMGVLRASIVPEVSSSGKEVRGVVGSDKKHAPFMEFGTRPHWPPISALVTWARRHGTSAYLVARAIARKGIKERRMLREGLAMNRDRIKQRFIRAVKEIVR